MTPSLPSTKFVAALGIVTTAVVAQDPTTQQLLERISSQESRIQSLENAQRNGPDGTGYEVGYEKGYFIRSTNPDSPFNLRINGRMQFRFVGFDADRGGMTSAQPNYRNDFEIERGRLEFSGTMLDAKTKFYFNLDADTDDNHQMIFHDFWIEREFCKAFSLFMGKAFVPGSRDWLSGSTSTHLIDRSMATTFFRPDRTLGIWAIGEPIEDFHYRVMFGNGINTTDLEAGQVDNKFAYAASFWWDPLAEYGSGYADLQQHEELAMRVGTTFMYADEENGQDPSNNEADAVRLSNGQRVTAVGADSFDIQMAAVDAALKYQGLAVHSEMFFRELDEITAPTNANVRRSHYDWGGYCDAGYMLCPKELELVARVSTVQGSLDESWEYAGGLNWYIDGTHKNKFSVDATKLDGSPTSNSGPNYRVGDDGWLFRIQYQIAF